MKKKSSSLTAKNNDNFFERVYYVVRQIPQGRVTTYGTIAKFIGSPMSSRMVGWAMNVSHAHDHLLPAHRVVNRNGMLTGKAHFRNPDMMQELLESEGIEIEDDCIIDFHKHFWDPYKELI
jgi:methylated-DNA-protein-cysteine methyltransferase-like protein